MAIAGELREHIGRIAPIVLAGEQVLGVPEVFHPLLPGGGLQRGWTTAVSGGSSARALAWALVSETTTTGGWVAAVDVPGISLAAAREVGVAIERVLVITSPTNEVWSAAVGALIGAVDVVMFGSPRHRVVPSEHRRMASRARERGSVLMELIDNEPITGSGRQSRSRGRQLQYDLSFDARPGVWAGLGAGHGCLRARTLDVTVSGRRAGGPTRRAGFELPAIDGSLRAVEEHGTVTPLPVREAG